MVSAEGIIKLPIKLILIFICIIYIVSPVDILPEILLGPLGLVDDAIAVFIIISLVRGRGITESVEGGLGKMKMGLK